jgi:hypothetical protein
LFGKKNNMDREIVECLSCGLYYGRNKTRDNKIYFDRISICPGCGLSFIVGYKGLDRNKHKDTFSEMRERTYFNMKSSGIWVR